MKTVQQWLRELDTQKLVDAFSARNPIVYDDCNWKQNLTVRQIRKFEQMRVRRYINRLRNIALTKPDNEHRLVLYTYMVLEGTVANYETRLVDLDNLLEKGIENTSASLDYEYRPQSEIAGYYVADTPENMKQIYDVMSEVLTEASFSGYEQEELGSRKLALEEALCELNSLLEQDEKSERSNTCEMVSRKDANPEEELKSNVFEGILAYNNYSRKKALTELINLFQEDLFKDKNRGEYGRKET